MILEVFSNLDGSILNVKGLEDLCSTESAIQDSQSTLSYISRNTGADEREEPATKYSSKVVMDSSYMKLMLQSERIHSMKISQDHICRICDGFLLHVKFLYGK